MHDTSIIIWDRHRQVRWGGGAKNVYVEGRGVAEGDRKIAPNVFYVVCSVHSKKLLPIVRARSEDTLKNHIMRSHTRN